VTTSFTVSKEREWKPYQFVMVPTTLLTCDQLSSNSKLLFMFLISQVNFKAIGFGTLDNALSIHRTTRARCMAELRAAGLVKGDERHLVLCDPIPILRRLRDQKRSADRELDEIIERASDVSAEPGETKTTPEQRDYLKDATDAWNRYRPKDYQKIRRISSQLVKAVDTHMRELGVKAHDYDEFFSILKSGIEKDPWWSKANSTKTLQSITGIGSPTDKKKGNVYKLFNDGIDAPSSGLSEEERADTVVYPASYRKLIDEYDAAQTAYSQAYFDRQPLEDVAEYVIRTEADLVSVGLDPGKFRYRYGIANWPTSTPEPKTSRVVNWTYDDEYGHVY
jgi:hypothetical protein